MHPDLSPHLHSEGCNRLINLLHECHNTKSVGKFFGQCNEIDLELRKCLKQERKNNQRANREKALERQKKVQEALKSA